MTLTDSEIIKLQIVENGVYRKILELLDTQQMYTERRSWIFSHEVKNIERPLTVHSGGS